MATATWDSDQISKLLTKTKGSVDCCKDPVQKSTLNHWIWPRWLGARSIGLTNRVEENVLDDLNGNRCRKFFRKRQYCVRFLFNNRVHFNTKHTDIQSLEIASTCDIRPCTCSTVILALSRVIFASCDSSCNS